MKNCRLILIIGGLCLFALSAKSQADDVMLVEYVDWTSGSGLGLKIYNPTDASIDLSGYAIQIYNNGNTAPNSTGDLTGILAAGGTAIAGNGQYASICAGTVDMVLTLSGVNDQDVVTLAKNGQVIDAIGAIGYTGNYMINGNVVNQSLKWVKVIREEYNCIRYTQNDGVSPNSWPTNANDDFTGWNVLPVTCLDPAVGYSISSPAIALDTAICAGDSVFFNGSWLFQSGDYSYSLPSQFQCDTIWNLHLEVLGTETNQVTETVCHGDSIFAGGYWQTAPGVYTDTIQIPGVACYSLTQTTLEFSQPDTVNQEVELCQGDSILIDGNYVGESGTYSYFDHIGNDPCPVNFIYQVDVSETLFQSMSFTNCEPYTYNGETYNSSTVLMDTIQSVLGCDSLIREVSILIVPLELEISGPSGICTGEPVFLEAESALTPIWNTGDSAFSIIDTPLQSQWYWAEVSSETCYASDSVYVQVSNLELTIPTAISLDYGETMAVNVVIDQGFPISTVWTPDNAGIDSSDPFSPVFSPVESTWYILTGKDPYGCTSIDSMYVEVIDPTLNIPNVITPNGDGFNDKLIIEDLPENNAILIYNRWGTEIFSASPYLNNWDGNGRDIVEGPYFYILTVYFGNQRMDATGNISILE